MILHSTNRQSPEVDFVNAITNCVAPDGGIYMPDRLPRLPKAFYGNIAEMSLQEIAYVVLNSLLGNIVSSSQLKAMVYEALNFDVPLHRNDANSAILELYHGPTLSFKDVGARFMAELLACLSPAPTDGRTVILATSGDCGGAVAQAFRTAPNTKVCVLYPKDVLSREQIRQFSTVNNATAVEVDGSFDCCQQLIRTVIKGHSISPRQLVWGNSVNAARQLPLVVYFFYAYALALKAGGEHTKFVVSVPCGNLGNLTAALMAKKMGLPIHRIVAACSTNDVVARYIDSGVFEPAEAKASLSGPLEVGNPLNMARILDLCGGNATQLGKEVEAVTINDDMISQQLAESYESGHYLMDPQTALAVAALNKTLQSGESAIALGCTHPAKCAQVIHDKLNVLVPYPRQLTRHNKLTQHIVKIPANASALKRVLGNI